MEMEEEDEKEEEGGEEEEEEKEDRFVYLLQKLKFTSVPWLCQSGYLNSVSKSTSPLNIYQVQEVPSNCVTTSVPPSTNFQIPPMSPFQTQGNVVMTDTEFYTSMNCRQRQNFATSRIFPINLALEKVHFLIS
ncbi:hypothetical protein DUI87_11373 [Hirundo rustica rustica]|uniref:Uncharacterized protein n=1 Tax=Hirundo rustica rustica TaxID=333673 RepID=A0A3M0KE40_HIRRU|nr:hypothetical protein DUI87_11373 [Hirundo rustica rustica]